MEPSSVYYKKSSIKPLPPEGGGGGGWAYLFQAHLREEINRDRELIWEGGIFILAKMIISVPHKKLECQVQKLIPQVRWLEIIQPRIKI